MAAMLEPPTMTQSVFAHSGIPMWIHDFHSGRFLAVNDAAVYCYGWSREEWLRGSLRMLLSDADAAVFARSTPYGTLVDGGRHRRRDGSVLEVEISAREIDFGETRACFVVAIDVSECRRAEERRQLAVLHDPLTGLPNRILFEDRLSQAIAHAHRRDAHLALISIELGSASEALGESAIGDLAENLRSTLRTTDTIARLGQARFGILVEDLTGEEHALEVALKLVEAIESRIEVDPGKASVPVCMGISIFPRDGHDAEMLSRNSGHALTSAKETGPRSITFFDESMTVRFSE